MNIILLARENIHTYMIRDWTISVEIGQFLIKTKLTRIFNL